MYKIEQTFPKELEYAEKLVQLMDDQFKIPFLNFRFGIDPIIGLVPWAGDLISFVISSLIISAFVRNGVPFLVILRMIANIVLDLIVGGIPVLGSVWDFFFKANRKNLKLAREYFEVTE
jgi:biotin transporter BioY